MEPTTIEKKPVTRNINVEVEENLYFDLKAEANKRHVEFHDYVRLLFQEAIK